MNSNKALGLTTIIAAVVLVATANTSVLTTITTTIEANAVDSNATNSSTVKVQVGGGNATAPLTTFYPQQVEIKAGSSVSWYNPTKVGEPHTVTFVLDNKSMTDFGAPFSVSSSTQFMSLPPGSNSQPAIIPGKNGMNTVVAINGRVANPVIIGASGSVKFAAPNASYTLNGTEKYVNSGVILPKGHEKEFPGSSNTFTVTFQKPGIYPYLCIIHPWMKGKVVVK